MNISNKISHFLSEKKYGDALNFLDSILEKDPENALALAYKNQINEILKFSNLDIYGGTNLFMDPWE